jgi:hypothetical protein
MSSVGLSARAGQLANVTKHHICCTNGMGEPRIVVGDVEPGSIVRFGIDDDMTVLVVANFKSGSGKKPTQTLVMFGCFCDEPERRDMRPYEEGRLMTHQFGVLDTISVVFEPGTY